ncbi:predicted protein [Sparassis crispa]|uniref:Vacuolar sorting protein 39/Transforming growth factor beta receptor-associated domain-containing protein n=1 Tax=Sparassis crispa TaxID=139825 RepID=A0A401H389_9APHY|nr:predicted protein [Sparassis crispa]GBE88874.1 predicted protein [Sparassis crispa]
MSSRSRHASFLRGSVLVLGSDSVQSLLPSTLVSQVDALLESHRIEDAVNLAEQQRTRFQSMSMVDGREADELRYAYQRIGFQCLTETLFDDAGKHLFAGDLDPRLLISFYPELRGSLFGVNDSIDVFAGVSEHMPMEGSMDDIIINYSPHLPPSTREAPATVELRGILGLAAKDMLEVYLRKWRTKYGSKDAAVLPKSSAVRTVVDTVLAKLYAAAGKTAELDILIDEPNYIILPEIEPVLAKFQRYSSLCRLYRRCGEDNKLLDVWSKLVQGEWVDESVQDPLSSMFTLLNEKRDRTLIQRWGIWLTKRDAERALKLLTFLVSGKRKAEDDRSLLQQVQEVSPSAGIQLLEHLVLQKRSTDPDLHMQLAVTYVNQLLSHIADEAISKLWRAKASSYGSNPSDSSFLAYFSLTTPDSDSKRVRLKTVLFLQGSALYDPKVVLERLVPHEKLLRLELAIVHGKLGQHRTALSMLVHDLHDATSAEVYCTLGGEIIPVKTAQSLGERYDLQPWAALLVPPATAKTKPSAVPMSRPNTVDADLKKSLIGILLEVYMSGGEATADQTARFLNAQAMNLDVLDVLSLIPPEWPLRVLSTFLTRSFRRTLHARHEAQIVKAISAGENLVTADRTWRVLREQGAVIEEAVSDDEEGDGGDLGVDEKGVPASFDEKVELRGHEFDEAEQGNEGVVDIEVAPLKESVVVPDPGSEVEIGT